jgi:ABC-type transport system involved in multi-copper enzyme maturation permease subunit
MIRLIRIELLKLRTIRLTYGLLATAAALSALFGVLEATRSGPGKAVAPLSTTAGLNSVITGGVWSLLLAAILGICLTSGEFRHKTATLTYLATPDRARVMIAKGTAAAVAGAVFGLVGFAIAAGIGLGFAAGHGYPISLTDATLARYAVGHLLAGGLLAAIGVAIGSLLRSQLAGVIGWFVWAIIIESVLGGLFTAIQPYLPYTAATTLAGSPLGDAAFGPAHKLSAGTALPFAGATGVLLGLTVVLGVIAAASTLRRDVT